MTFDEAKAHLNTLFRSELVDRTFGDAEVYWSVEEEGDDVASGYFGRDCDEVTILGKAGFTDSLFTGADARALRSCGKLSRRTRNDNATNDD